jgi:hypothetical protein
LATSRFSLILARTVARARSTGRRSIKSSIVKRRENRFQLTES